MKFSSNRESEQKVIEKRKKMENLEEGYYVSREMSKDIFDKFYGKLNQERLEIARQLNKGGEMISNPEYAIEKALEI